MKLATSGISIREFARRDGCDDKLVRRALQRSHLKADESGRLDPQLVGTGWRRRNAERIAGLPSASSAGGTVSAPADSSADELQLDSADLLISKAEAERRKEIALAKLREMEVDRERQRVVPVDEVAAMVVAEYAKVRTRLIGLPAKVASRAAVMKSAAEIQAMIADEVTEALKELSLDAGGDSPCPTTPSLSVTRFGKRSPSARFA